MMLLAWGLWHVGAAGQVPVTGAQYRVGLFANGPDTGWPEAPWIQCLASMVRRRARGADGPAYDQSPQDMNVPAVISRK